MATRLKLLIGAALGAVGGYAWYHFVGCSGGCAITSDPTLSASFGAVFGLILSYPGKKKQEKENDKEKFDDRGNNDSDSQIN